MKKQKGQIQLSASDLSNFLSCHHITELDQKVVTGKLNKPEFSNPHAQVLRERGHEHEKNYLDHLKSLKLEVTEIPEDLDPVSAHQMTLKAMKEGVEIISQAVFLMDSWFGRLDILRKVKKSSSLGDYSYEVIDTKLSRETKAGAILQLSLYSEMLEKQQGQTPENMYVVTPGEPFNEEKYRFQEYRSYYELIKSSLRKELESQSSNYPEPVMHCDVCKWYEVCNKKRRDDDHLSFVAGLTGSTRKQLFLAGIKTLEELASQDDDFTSKIEDSNPELLLRVKEQARMQLLARDSGKPSYELLNIEKDRGLNRLPLPSEGDIFFDLEGDRYYKDAGLEYLWGYSYLEDTKLNYASSWAFNYREEKREFEKFVDFVIERKKKYPELKIYHYAAYEPGALKRLMGRYGTKENEIDHLLRTETFVDLYSIVRQSVRAGIEKYSIKDLEQFYGYERKARLEELVPVKRLVEHSIELSRLDTVTEDAKSMLELYNKDDTDSTFYLRNWLEDLRELAAKEGKELTRPLEKEGEVNEELSEELRRLNELRDKLHEGISDIPEERTNEEQAQWLLGDLIGFYRREDKVTFWEKFRLQELDSLELLEDKSAISGLKLMEEVDRSPRGIPTHRYSFVDQICDVRKNSDLFLEGILYEDGPKRIASVVEIDYEKNTVDIKKAKNFYDTHPSAVWAWNIIPTKTKAERMLEFAEFVIENGFSSSLEQFRAARDILLRANPRLSEKINLDEEDKLSLAKDMASSLDCSYLAVQGPPGTGKSYSASRVILELVRKGKRVGVTGLSHKVISNLLEKIYEASQKENIDVKIFKKMKQGEDPIAGVEFVKKNDKIAGALYTHENVVVGGTDFMWASDELANSLDYLVVDEAGQFSLVGILSIAHATKNIILLGDGAQLKQPIQGSHPDGCETSALDHIVGDHKTLPKEKGVFLPTTYRLHPEICRFCSEMFYENRLHAIKENIIQNISGKTEFAGTNLALVEVNHWGNTNHSLEEVSKLEEIVESLVKEENYYSLFKDGEEIKERVTYDSIKIITPYNAQVNRIKQALPKISVGTVDKFQGQEAPIILYSVATSSPEDAPRGMDFLYSGNRLNVAVSRAECLFIMIANREIFEPNCKTPAQMKLANAYCRFLEMASEK